MQARLVFMSQEERDRSKEMGIDDLDKVYTAEDMARGEVFFTATGVTSSDFLPGVGYRANGATTHSIVMRSKSRTVRFIETRHQFDYKPVY